ERERELHRRTDTAAPSRSSAVDAPSLHSPPIYLFIPQPPSISSSRTTVEEQTERERASSTDRHRRSLTEQRRRRSVAIVRAFTADLLAPSPATVNLVFKDRVEEQVPSVCSGLPGSSTVLFRWPCSPIFVPSSDHVLPVTISSSTERQRRRSSHCLL
ncbi:hypothetical protein PIB30_103689, partial [Stylosanthes scabra]|nr:hypothetical protein [Stylosanthes scabra]